MGYHFITACWLARALKSIAALFANKSFNKVEQPLNYNVVIEVLSRFYDRIDARNSSIWTAFQMVCRQLPREEVDRICGAQDWTNLSDDQFKRLLSIRCDLVKNSAVERSWSWINAVVDSVGKNQMYMSSLSINLFNKLKKNYSQQSIDRVGKCVQSAWRL